MRRISVIPLLILFLFAFAGWVAAQGPTPLQATPIPRPSPIPTPTSQPGPTMVASTPQGDQGTDWNDVLALPTFCIRVLTLAATCIFAVFAILRWLQDRAASALDQLYQEYQEDEFAKALRKIGEFEWDEGSPDNRYGLAQAFLFDKRCHEERDKARRILTTFWYRVAILLDRKVISDENTFALLGRPTIVKKLEPLEVVKADRLGTVFPVEWPPLALLDRSRRREKRTRFPILPLSQEEFDDWKKESPPP